MDSPLLYIQSVTSQQPLSSLHIGSHDPIKVYHQEINYAEVPNMPVASQLLSLNTSDNHSNGSIPFEIVSEPPCQWIQYAEIGNSRVRIWDLIILIPNAMFLLFLLWNLRFAIAKLRSMSSCIFAAFFSLVVAVAVISVLRCIVSMTVNASDLAGDVADKVLWLVLRFFLLGTELSVVIFGLAFGHLESQTSIRRVLLMTSTIALLYSSTQGILEFLHPDKKFYVKNKYMNFNIFAHGGMIFWTASSAFFFVVYSVIFILPWTRLKQKLNLPSKKSFYLYAAILAILNFVQTVGSSMLLDTNTSNLSGMCVVDVTSYLYFTFFDPLVYGTFLREFFQVTPPGILFSYKPQMDEIDNDDTVSLPYQASNSKDGDEDMDASFDSTHFDRQHGIFNPGINSYVVGIASGSLRLDPEYYQNSA
ncbi:hypothetical protein CHS0354_021712 [Potamilus streckersoni]|uniref:Transmembrane protein adipocyte-associated 1 n=1 Tax=Potamilus streckersoni TaxID=2493646 RepID=A0AAE0TLA6_9BIVA|nr:hypothetical protein CHS0354_021712 [Potamilus streckersoni]